MAIYNPTDANFLTVAQSRTNNGQKDVRVILDITANTFYTLDDDGNFNLIDTPSSIGFKQYVSYVTQNGITAPSALLVKNELSAPITFARTGVGLYTISGTSAFSPYQKVVPYFNVQSSSITPNTPHILIYWNDVDSLGVETYDDDNLLADGIFTGNLVITLYD